MLWIFTALADLVAFDWLGLRPGTGSGEAVHFFVEDVTKIFFLLVSIIFVIGLFRSMLTPERVRGYFRGRSRGASYGLAVGLGAVTPFCSCSSVPLFIGFLEAGIPLGVTMAFLIASPMINEVAVVLLVGVVGWQVAALYVVTGLAVGMLGGFLADRFKLDRYVEDYVWKIRMGQVALPDPDLSLQGRMRYAAGEVRDIVKRVWLYVLIGVGLGAGLHGFVPESFFAEHAGRDSLFAPVIAVLAGIPLYANAAGAVPVAEALLNKAVPVGTVLALMMSIAAISLPEMLILRKVLRWRMLAIFAGYLAAAFIAVGYLFNAIV